MNLTSTELAIREWIPHSAPLTKTMLWITSLGNWEFVIVLALLLSAFFWSKGKRKLLIPFWALLGGTELTVEILKLAVHRARPIGASFLETSYSFPSGHAAISVALYGFLAFIFWKRSKSRLQKGAILTATLLIVLLIGFSRVYLGVHFPTDVLGGYLVGSIWLWIATHHKEWAKNLIAR
jgi:membrane-associated phospholipid phosphatase